jgi:hypothetical protein
MRGRTDAAGDAKALAMQRRRRWRCKGEGAGDACIYFMVMRPKQLWKRRSVGFRAGNVEGWKRDEKNGGLTVDAEACCACNGAPPESVPFLLCVLASSVAHSTKSWLMAEYRMSVGLASKFQRQHWFLIPQDEHWISDWPASEQLESSAVSPLLRR